MASSTSSDKLRVSLYRRDGASNNFDKLPDDETLFVKPTLLCCGGVFINTQNDEHARHANGFTKIGHALLGFKDSVSKADPIDIVTVAYPASHHTIYDNLREYSEARMNRQLPPGTEYATHFAAQYLFPLVQDEKGNARDIDTIKKNLRNVHVLAHSYGAAFIQQVGNALVDKMKTLQFSRELIAEALSQIVVVTAGPTVPLGVGDAPFTTLNVVNFYDTELNNLYPIRNMVKRLLTNAPHPPSSPLVVEEENAGRGPAKSFIAKPLIVAPLSMKHGKFRYDPASREYIVLSSPVIWKNPFGQYIERPTFNPFGVAEMPGTGIGDVSYLGRDETNHQASTYFHYDFDADGKLTLPGFMPRTIMSSVLVNSMNNALQNATAQEFSPLAPVETLMAIPRKQSMQYVLDDGVNFVESHAITSSYAGHLEQALVKAHTPQLHRG